VHFFHNRKKALAKLRVSQRRPWSRWNGRSATVFGDEGHAGEDWLLQIFVFVSTSACIMRVFHKLLSHSLQPQSYHILQGAIGKIKSALIFSFLARMRATFLSCFHPVCSTFRLCCSLANTVSSLPLAAFTKLDYVERASIRAFCCENNGIGEIERKSICCKRGIQ
jgi:hypothetical protein